MTRYCFGCPFCSERKFCDHNSLKNKYKDLVDEWHPTKNIGKDISDYTPANTDKVWWLCKNKCAYGCIHEWEARINHRTRDKSGCPYCAVSGKKFCYHKSLEFLRKDLMLEWDYLRNKKKPSEFRCYNKSDVYWICSINNEHKWVSKIHNRSNGYGCPICKHKTEKIVFDYLVKMFKVIHQARFGWCSNDETGKKLPFDFCIEKLKLMIEIDGSQHFKQIMNWKNPEENRKFDIMKMKQANDNGYSVIRILQLDIYFEKNDWKENLISNIKLYTEPVNIFISDGDEYEKHISDMNNFE